MDNKCNTIQSDNESATPQMHMNGTAIKVIGLGNGGSRAVSKMHRMESESEDVSFFALDSDPLSESVRQILEEGAGTAIIISCLGGEKGSETAQEAAQLSHDMGIRTIGIVTLPFHFEGRERVTKALVDVQALKSCYDNLVVVDDNGLIDYYTDLTFGNAFDKADEILSRTVIAVTGLLNTQNYAGIEASALSEDLRKAGISVF